MFFAAFNRLCRGTGIVVMLLAAMPAYAEPLPWLYGPVDAVADKLTESSIDPWKTEKRLNDYGNKLRPDNCISADGVERKLLLSEVVMLVLCHNPDARVAYKQLLVQAATLGEAYSPYLPRVDATLSRSRTTTFAKGFGTLGSNSKSANLSASLLLYDFGQREISVDIAERTLVAAGRSYDSTLQGTIATAMKSYYQLLTAQNAVDIDVASENYAKEGFDAAQLRHHLGLVALADELQAKASYSNAKITTEEARNSLYQAQSALALLMGAKPNVPLLVAELNDKSLMEDPFDDRLDALMEEAKEKRVDLQARRLGLDNEKDALRGLKRAHLATISAGVNANVNNVYPLNSTGHDQSIGISVSIPIFTGFNNTYVERAAREQLESDTVGLESAERNVENDVFTAWHNYQTAKQAWETTWDQLAAATELKDVTLGRYKEGLGTILDVLGAQDQYSRALQSQLNTRLQLFTARADLVRAVGVLDLENYDPKKKSLVTEAPPATLSTDASGENYPHAN